MAALYESWIRPTVIILTVPLAMFGAVVGLWLYDMPLDVFGQIGLVMLIGLETKNAILIVEFGVEMRRDRGMSILEAAKAASRERLRPILMTSFAFVMGVLPMARSMGAGAYSRNSLGIVIAFGIAVSTILGRFVSGTTAGALIERVGYVDFYLLTAAITLPGIGLYLYMLRRGLVAVPGTDGVPRPV